LYELPSSAQIGLYSEVVGQLTSQGFRVVVVRSLGKLDAVVAVVLGGLGLVDIPVVVVDGLIGNVTGRRSRFT